MRTKEILIRIIIILLFLGGPLYVLFSGQVSLNQHWRFTNRKSANIAPDPNIKEAIVNIYTARAFGMRGLFAIHTWIATKPANSNKYTIYQCFGWNIFRNRPIIVVRQDIPDRYWFGNKPSLIFDLRGPKAELAIKQIQAAVKTYPYHSIYRMWPGPNSNSFTADIIRHAKAISIALPVTAIGKDYFPGLCATTPSNTGYQCALWGLVGFTLARKEGIEINILTLSYAINATPPYIHLPGIG